MVGWAGKVTRNPGGIGGFCLGQDSSCKMRQGAIDNKMRRAGQTKAAAFCCAVKGSQSGKYGPLGSRFFSFASLRAGGECGLAGCGAVDTSHRQKP